MTDKQDNSESIRVFIIDDSAIEAISIGDILESDGSVLDVVEVLPTTVGAVAMITSLRPDVVLLRVSVSDEANSLEFINTMKLGFPNIPLAVITCDNSTKTIMKALHNGASSYMLNTTTAAELKSALITTSEHGSVLSPEVARKMLVHVNTPRTIPITASSREIEILRLISTGLSNKDIGDKLFLSARTVESHLNHMYVRFGVSTRTQAVLFALRNKLLHLADSAAVNS